MPEWWRFSGLLVHNNAGVVEWYTRTTQNRVSQGMGVRVSPPAQQLFNNYDTLSLGTFSKESGAMDTNPVILAYDKIIFGNKERELLRAIAPYIGGVKIGIEAMTALMWGEGVELEHVADHVRAFVTDGLEPGLPVMWDAKLHDIGESTIRALVNILGTGVSMVTVHATMSESTLRNIANMCRQYRVLPLAVTVLTDLDRAECQDVYMGTPDNTVVRLAERTLTCGIKGLVCSPQELLALEREGLLREITTVVPGVRPSWATVDDHKRVMTPREAVQAGANHLVIGRPIMNAGDPAQAAQLILEELKGAS